MEVKQIYQLVNNITGEVLGKTDLVAEDLKNIVDVGTEIFNANAMDNYVKSLVNHIGKVLFVNRPYSGKVPTVLMDAWEFGSILEKVSADNLEATENKSWELEDKKDYSQDIFYKPKVSAKFFNSRVTFEIPVSITERQVKESFSSAAQYNGFVSMIYAAIDRSMTIKTDALIMRTINNAIGDAFTPATDQTATPRAINLLAMYNTQIAPATPLKAANAITDPAFIRFAAYTLGVYSERLQSISTLFNGGGKERFTPKDMLKVVLLADFGKAAQTYLYGDTFHEENVLLPNADFVPYWQGSGKGYDFKDTSAINITTAGGNAINKSGILGVMFDRDAIGVTNLDRRVTTNYNAKAEFFNNYFKFDAGYFLDNNENFIVFYIADEKKA